MQLSKKNMTFSIPSTLQFTIWQQHIFIIIFSNTPWASGWKNIKTMKWEERKALCLSRYYLYNILVLPSHVYAMLHSVYLPWSEDPCKLKNSHTEELTGHNALHSTSTGGEWLQDLPPTPNPAGAQVPPLALCIQGSAPSDSASCGLHSTVCINWKRSMRFKPVLFKGQLDVQAVLIQLLILFSQTAYISSSTYDGVTSQ